MKQLRINNEMPACYYCQMPLLLKPDSIVFQGFIDQDTNQIVCSKCKGTHYQSKPEKTFSEMPITLPAQKQKAS